MPSSLPGLPPVHLETLRNIFDSVVTQQVPLQVFLFGSRARGDHKPYSDVDLLIVSPSPLPRITEHFLLNNFEESNLPFKVDLVPIAELHANYRDQIEREKVLLYSRN